MHDPSPPLHLLPRIPELNPNSLLSLLRQCYRLKHAPSCRSAFALLACLGLDSPAYFADHAIRMFSASRCLLEASQVFAKTPHRTACTWGAIISAHSKLGEGREALQLFHDMLREGVDPDKFVLSCLLKTCGDLKFPYSATLIHHHITYAGVDADDVLCNSLLYAYAEFGSLHDAWHVFSNQQNHDLISWATIIMAYADHGHGSYALDLYAKMRFDGIKPDKVLFLATLKASSSVRSLNHGVVLHDEIIKSGLESDMHIGSSLLDMYSKCGWIKEASKIFETLPHPNMICWSAMISGFAEHGHENLAIGLYVQMQQKGIQADEIVFLSGLKVCSGIRTADLGRILHAHIIETQFEVGLVVGSGIIDMYSKCACVDDAHKVFDRLKKKDAVVWSTMISGYSQNGWHSGAVQLFERMDEEGILPNTTAFLCMLKACGSIGSVNHGMILHDQIVRSAREGEDSIATSLIDMYVKLGILEESHEVFSEIPYMNTVSCSAIAAGYVEHGQRRLALDLLRKMNMMGIKIDNIMLHYLLKSSASIGSLDYGRGIHHLIVESDLKIDSVLGNGLVEMYANCGRLDEACKVFESMPNRDVVSWGSMVAGYAQLSDYCLVEDCLKKMRNSGVEPNDVIFNSLLNACSRNSLMDAGCHYFTLMQEDYKISPTIEHYSCMIDLLGHVGYLLQAEDLSETMPSVPNVIIWASKVSSFRACGYPFMHQQCIYAVEANA